MDIIKSLGIEPQVVLAQAIAFLVLMVVVWRFLFKPFNAILQQRQEQIANNLANAEAQQERAEALRKDYEAHLAGIADEARLKLEQATKDAEVARQRLLESAKTEIDELHRRNQAQLALEREQLRRELRTEMSELAVLAAGKALRAQLTPGLQSAVNDQMIAELDRLPGMQN